MAIGTQGAADDFINGDEVHFVVKGQQYPGDDEVTDGIAEDELKIAELRAGQVAHFPGDRNKGDAAQGSADHPKSNEIPFRGTVGNKEGRVVSGFSGGKIRYRDQHQEITEYETKQDGRRHKIGGYRGDGRACLGKKN